MPELQLSGFVLHLEYSEAVGAIVTGAGISHAVPSTVMAGLAVHYAYPGADRLDDGWDTQPTPGQDLFNQLDENPASDTDYIEKT